VRTIKADEREAAYPPTGEPMAHCHRGCKCNALISRGPGVTPDTNRKIDAQSCPCECHDAFRFMWGKP
jgi:hypothetical protein